MTQTPSRDARQEHLAIPAALNVTLLLAAGLVAAGLLRAASHAASWTALVLAAVAFSFVNNTLFSLLHEATHDILHPRRRVNDWMGRIAAAFFPTSFTLQRAFHLTHHRYNRTEREQFDYFRPRDSTVLKLAQWYSILTGLYWIFSPVGCVVFSLFPRVFRRGALRDDGSAVAQQTGADAYLGSVDDVPAATIRLETFLSAAIQIAMAAALDLTLAGWGCCYAAFAVNWSALQYADHAFSPLDVREGAWNLRVNPVVRLVFLNYHHHLAHHRHPRVPWIHLPRLVDRESPRPRFLHVYLQMWRGPRAYPGQDAAPRA